MNVKYLSGLVSDHKAFKQALKDRRKRKFDYGWGILPMRRCPPEEAKGVLFQAHVEFKHGSGRLLDWGTHNRAKWDYAVMLGMFAEGNYQEALSVLQKRLECEKPEVIWVKPIGSPKEHTYKLVISLVATPGYYGNEIFVSKYWIARYLGDGPDFWDCEKEEWVVWESESGRNNVPDASVLSLDDALETGLSLAHENKCPIDFGGGETGVLVRAKKLKPTPYLLEVIGRFNAGQNAMEKHNKSLSRRKKS